MNARSLTGYYCGWRVVAPLVLALFVSTTLSSVRADDFDQIRKSSAQRHTELALAYRKAAKLQLALREWRIVDALTNGREARQQILELELVIKARSAGLLLEAEQALKAGEEKLAKRYSLAVLALDPENTVARNTVRLIESGQKLVDLSVDADRKIATEHQKDTATSAVVSDDNRAVPVNAISIVQQKPAVETNASDKMTHRQTLAERHFRQGLELFLSDRSAAIAEFTRSLKLNPDHALARRYRSTALRLQ